MNNYNENYLLNIILDLVDGIYTPEDLSINTGLPVQRCREIIRVVTETRSRNNNV